MNDLQLYGWNEELFRQKQESNYKDFIHGRVTVTHRTCYESSIRKLSKALKVYKDKYDKR